MSLADDAKLLLIPTGYKTSKVYSVFPTDGDGDFTYTRSGNASRVNPGGLIETVGTNIPRIDHFGGGCPTLLLEPQRTNKIIQSENWGTSWSFFNGASISTNQTIAPDGTMTADKIVSNGTNFGFTRPSSNPVISTGNTTFSLFVKADNRTTGWLRLDYGTTIYNRKFDLTTQTFSTGFDNTGNIPDSEQIINYGNGWYRLIITDNANTTSFEPRIYVTGNTGSSVNDSLFLWGAQVENGSYPTSYIKTTTGIETRQKDNCHLLNQTLFTDYPFTVYAKAKVDNFSNVAFSLIDSLASNKYLSIQFTSSSQIGVLRRDASNNDSDYYSFSYSIGDTLKIAISYVNDTSYKLYVNGTELADITSGTSIPFDHNDISLGQFRIASDTGTRNSIDDFRVYDYTLTNTELTELTTL